MMRRVEDGLIPPGADEDFGKLYEPNPPQISKKMKLLLEFFVENWFCVHILGMELIKNKKLNKKHILDICQKADFFKS